MRPGEPLQLDAAPVTVPVKVGEIDSTTLPALPVTGVVQMTL